MRVLVTGAAGCIGSNLCNALLNRGDYVVGIDNYITGQKENIEELAKNSRFRFLKFDITKPFSHCPDDIFDNISLIYHLACPTGVPNLTRLAEEMIQTCSAGTNNVLELARQKKARVVFTSSSEVYGNPKESPQKISYTGNVDPTGVRSPYEEGKRFSETLCTMYVRKYGVDARIVRVFNTYGPRMSMKDERVIPTLLTQAFANEPLTIHGGGNQMRTFCYVDDLVNALITVMEKGEQGHVYNAGSDKQITIRELAETIKKITNTTAPIATIPRPTHDHQSRLPDLTELKKLGWDLTVPLTSGLEKTIQSMS